MVFNMSSPIHCLSRAVIIQQHHLLVCYNPQATFSYVALPGGHIENGESAEDSLIRELKEETSLSFQIQRFLGVLEYSFVPKKEGPNICHTHEYNFCFLAHSSALKGLELPPEPEQDKVRFKWIALSDLARSNLLPSPLIKLLPLWLQNSSAPDFFVSDML